jgi:hypothetical protein
MGIGDERTLELTGEKAAEVEAGREVFAPPLLDLVPPLRVAASSLALRRNLLRRERVRGCGGRTGCRRRHRRGGGRDASPRRRLLPFAAAASSSR